MPISPDEFTLQHHWQLNVQWPSSLTITGSVNTKCWQKQQQKQSVSDCTYESVKSPPSSYNITSIKNTSLEIYPWFAFHCVIVYFVVSWFSSYSPGFLKWHWGNHVIAPLTYICVNEISSSLIVNNNLNRTRLTGIHPTYKTTTEHLRVIMYELTNWIDRRM